MDFSFGPTTHKYFTRNQELQKPRVNNEFAKKLLEYNISDFVNSCSLLVKSKVFTHSLHGVTTYFKDLLLNSYETVCNVPNCYSCNRQ